VRSAIAPREVHHRVTRCVLRLRDRADACADPLSAEGLALWMDYELEALRFGVDPDVSREELATMIERCAVEIPGDEHREAHAEDSSVSSMPTTIGPSGTNASTSSLRSTQLASRLDQVAQLRTRGVAMEGPFALQTHRP
jgi:hypothetical protein